MSDVNAVNDVNAVTETPKALETAPATASASPTPTMSAAFATTPKRGTARKVPKEPQTLYAYAIEKGGRVELTAQVKAELVSRGLPEHRISNAAYGIRKCFGKDVKTERNGRSVAAYVVTL
jgi:hypothetical protein